jgi:hypothetical protein
MFAMLLAATISVQSAPAAEIQYRSHNIAEALERGCKVQQVSVAGGKADHAAIIRCPAQNPTEAKAAPRERSGV